jgi:hypothetical protein
VTPGGVIAGALPPRLLDPARRRSKAWHAAVSAAALGAAALANPVRPLPFDVCLFKHLTGLPCQTCGLTRAVCFAVRGEWAQSVAYHPAGPLVAVSLGVLAVWAATESYRGQPIAEGLRRRAGAMLLTAGAGLSLVTWVVRLVSGHSIG